MVYNVPPTASRSGSASIYAGQTGTVFFYSQSDAGSVDGSPGGTYPNLRYSYDFNGAEAFNTGAGDGTYDGSLTTASVTVPAQYLDVVGPHNITMRIINCYGGYTDYTYTITTKDVSPFVEPLFTSSPAQATVGTAFTASDLFIDPAQGVTFTGTVNYGDLVGGQPDVQILPLNSNKSFTLNHTYTTPATYTVTVTVTDSLNMSGSMSFQVVVAPAPVAPFEVTAFTPNVSGFDVTFDRAANISDVDLYDGEDSSGNNDHYGQPDVVVTLDGDTDRFGNLVPLDGSLIWDASSDTAHWVQTSGNPRRRYLQCDARQSGKQ